MPSFAAKMIKNMAICRSVGYVAFLYIVVIGANFSLCFRFVTCYREFFFFALWYFVNYASLLRAVCKFSYSLLSRPFLWT